MEITEKLTKLLEKASEKAGISDAAVLLEHPQELSFGDYSCNVAMRYAKGMGKNPKELAEEIASNLEQSELVERTEIAGPGFINFYLSDSFFGDAVGEVLKEGDDYGKNKNGKGQKAIVEYTDPNPFKLLHIGHLMSNTIGEAFSRLVEFSGYETKRANYQGDVGMHVAKSLWGLIDMGLDKIPYESTLPDQVAYLGKAYAHGSTVYKKGSNEKEVKEINKSVYDKSNEEINKLYNWGRQVSLDYFETQYEMLGTKFDYYFFESESGIFGKELVLEFLKKGVFEESDGAVIFDGEKHGLHKRVFLNSEKLPTYEAKELGLAKLKKDKFNYDLSIIITGNEIDEYFKVLLKAMSLVFPELAEKTFHRSHGMMKLPTGKMSSRTGDVVAASDLIDLIKEKVKERIKEKDDEELIEKVAIAALKFSILKQEVSKDIIYDIEKSISFEGDSGPYLQYTVARINSVLEKAEDAGIKMNNKKTRDTIEVEKYLYRFPEIVEDSLEDFAPHHVAQYLLELSRSFNSWYGNTKLVDSENENTPYNLSVAKAVAQTIKNGLMILGIKSPNRM
jgi:arginyl-tRNA synthetase